MSEQKLKLPKGWTNSSVEIILSVLENGARPKGGVKKITEGIPSIGGEHLSSNGKFNFKKIKFIPKLFFDSMTKGKIKENDILIVKDGATTGKVSLIRKDFPYDKSAVNEHVFIIRGIPEIILQKFLFYFLFSSHGQDHIHKKSTGLIGGINTSFVKDLQILIPSLNEQKRIVSKIEELFSELDHTKDTLEKVKLQLVQYRQSLLKSAFEGKLTEEWRIEKSDELESVNTILKILDNDCSNSNYLQIIKKSKKLPISWEFIKIGRMEKFVGSGITPKGGKSVYQDEGIPFIRSQNVYPNGLHLENIAYVSKELHNKMSRTHIQDYDVLLNITGASIGRANFIPSNFGEGNVNQHVCIIRCHSKVNPQFFSYWLNSPKCQDTIFSSQQGQTRQGLNYSQIRDMVFPICSLEEQEQIVSKLEQGFSLIENTEHITNTMLKQLETLRSSILKQAFEGKLVPQDPNDEPAEKLLQRIKEQQTKTKSRGKK